MKWKDKLIRDFEIAIHKIEEGEYSSILNKIKDERVTLHLAIFAEPFLGFLTSGVKTIESRFSINNSAPFRKVSEGDIVFVKKSAEGVCAIFEVDEVKYFSNLNLKTVELINQNYGKRLCWDRDSEFLDLKANSKFLTLIGIKKIILIPEFSINKSDRTSWVVIRRGLRNTLFDNEKNQ